MKVKKIVDSTTNRYVFNRAYKEYLERKGKIRCSYCQFHKNENDNRKWYGGIKHNEFYDDMLTCYGGVKETHTRYPNWKLISKNKKQWMNKGIKITEKYDLKRIYIEIKF